MTYNPAGYSGGGGGVVHNYGANSLQIKTLPLASASTSPITYLCVDADGIEIDVTGSDFIVAGDQSGTGKSLRSLKVGSSVTLTPVGTGAQWIVTSLTGSWILLNSSASWLTGLLASWSFNGGAITDSQGTYNLTQAGSSLTYPAGKLNEGVSFVGNTSNYLSRNGISDAAFNFGTSDFSISLWFKPGASTGAERTLIQKGTAWKMNIDPNDNAVVRNGGYAWYHTSPAVTSGNWYHWVVVRSGANGIIYFNNVAHTFSTAYNTVSMSNSDTTFFGFDGASGSYNGMIDDVGIWSRALTAGEVQSLYNSGLGSQVAAGATLNGLR